MTKATLLGVWLMRLRTMPEGTKREAMRRVVVALSYGMSARKARRVYQGALKGCED